MPDYKWPDRADCSVLGKSHDRIDGIPKSTGAAKYTYDINVDKMLIAKVLGSPHAHCRVTAIDTEPAKKVPGVVAVHIVRGPGAEAVGAGKGKGAKGGSAEVLWQGDLIAIVAAETEAAAAEGVAAIKVEYEKLDVFVNDEDLAGAEKAGRTAAGGGQVRLVKEAPAGAQADEYTQQELDRLFKESAAVVEGHYGIHAITHMCLEPHGATCAWDGDKLTAHLSTQNVSGGPQQFAAPLGITANEVTVHCDYIGGGFGSKFSADPWCVAAADIAKKTGRGVKLMLDRDIELKIAGCRPSAFIDVKVGADKDGVVTVWDSRHWGTGGATGGAVDPNILPYVFSPPNYRRRATVVRTNTSPTRAWRAPNHPQACAISQPAFDDIAAKLGLDSYDVFMRNLVNAPPQRAAVYAEEMKVGAQLMDWKAKWHPHGKGPVKGSVVSGLGMALHTWGGAGHASTCDLKIHPDGGVESFCGSQDLGTGTRTVMAIVVAETLGLPVDAIKVNIGSSKYATSGASGGSTTVGGVSDSHRRAAQDALEKICELVAPKLQVEAGTLEAKNGRIQVHGNADKGLAWKEACSLLGMNPLEIRGNRTGRGASPLTNNGVAGIQMAEVEVDKETGVVRVVKYVAVQDVGLVISPKTAMSQIYGAVIMGIAYALFEERIMDPVTGAFLNAELKDYRLPRLGDIGQIQIALYEPDSERSRGVIGLGEPPVISPGAAISNAVCNALGVRVPVLPMTPKRVLDAMHKA